MTILNMVWWWGNNINVPLNWISNLTASFWDWQAVIKRTDVWDLVVNWVTVNEWSCTKLVRKTGSAPASSNDWTPVLTETLENAYSVTGYTNTGLTNGTKYYYWAFSVGTNGLETISNIATVTPSAWWWQPWVNTIAYYEFDWNLDDSSWNNRNLSIETGVFTYGTESWWAKYVYMPRNSYTNNYASMPYNSTSYNISFWAKRIWSIANTWWTVLDFHTNDNYFPRIVLQNSSIIFVVSEATPYPSGFNTAQWHYYCLSISNNSATCYIDGAYYWTGALNSYNNNLAYFRINTAWFADDYWTQSWDGNLSELIIESVPRTAQEIQAYYNQTKANYWIS